jgi:hypothetical protein
MRLLNVPHASTPPRNEFYPYSQAASKPMVEAQLCLWQVVAAAAVHAVATIRLRLQQNGSMKKPGAR